MAIVRCPKCGQDISDKAKKCIHCGTMLIEVQAKYCAECGGKVPEGYEECPFCGCPVEEKVTDDSDIKLSQEKIKKSRKPIAILVGIVLVAIITILAFNYKSSSLNEDEQLAYQNTMDMKRMMKNPDSFKLYDEMFLLKHFDKNGENDFTYTIFKYGGTNGYGAITTDEAIYKDNKYIMNYADEPDKNDSDYLDKLLIKKDVVGYMLTGDTDEMKMIEIDVEKIKNKMEKN